MQTQRPGQSMQRDVRQRELLAVRAGDRPSALVELDSQTKQFVEGLGYDAVCVRGERGICAVKPFMFTGALVFGIGREGYVGRYCYESIDEAMVALANWTGDGDPPGDWIKLKSGSEERVGPGCKD